VSDVRARAILDSSSGVMARCCIARAIVCVVNHAVWKQARNLATLSALLLSYISFLVILGSVMMLFSMR
jgi:hypothetical protein